MGELEYLKKFIGAEVEVYSPKPNNGELNRDMYVINGEKNSKLFNELLSFIDPLGLNEIETIFPQVERHGEVGPKSLGVEITGNNLNIPDRSPTFFISGFHSPNGRLTFS